MYEQNSVNSDNLVRTYIHNSFNSDDFYFT